MSTHSKTLQIFEVFEGREFGNIGRMINEIVRWQVKETYMAVVEADFSLTGRL